MKKTFTKVGTWLMTSTLALLGFSGCSKSGSSNPGHAECIYGGPNMMDQRDIDIEEDVATTVRTEMPDSTGNPDGISGATQTAGNHAEEPVPTPEEIPDSTITEVEQDSDRIQSDPAAYREQLLRENRHRRYGRDVCLYGATNAIQRRNV